MRTSLYLSLCSVMVLSLSIYPIETNYCGITDANVSHAFIVDDDIYFGDDESYWKINIRNKQISDKTEFKVLFGDIMLERLTSGVHFGQIACNESFEKCNIYQKAQYVTLLIGTIGSPQNKYGYVFFKFIPGLDPMPVEAPEQSQTLTWGLIHEGFLSGPQFFPQGVDKYEGFTFDETTKTIYMSTITGTQNMIHMRSWDQNAEFTTPFNSIEAKRTYTALIDCDGKIYGLSDNKFYLLEFGNTSDVTEIKEFSARNFFFCEGVSPLTSCKTTNSAEDLSSTMDTVSGVNNPTNTEVTADSPEKEEPDDQPPGADTDPPTESAKTSPQTTPETKSASNWILWVVLILIIVVIIIAIILCLFCCKKPEEKEMTNKSKPDSKIVSEYDSGSMRTGAKTVDSQSKNKSKSDSAKSSSTGSEGGKQLSTKSDIESQVSVRSTKI